MKSIGNEKMDNNWSACSVWREGKFCQTNVFSMRPADVTLLTKYLREVIALSVQLAMQYISYTEQHKVPAKS